MNIERLDDEQLLHLALSAVEAGDHSEAISTLTALLARTPNHAIAEYLLAAEHAQIGMMDRAENGFRRSIELNPNFPMAHFQLGQLCMVKGDAAGARAAFAPLTSLPAGDALGGFARGLTAATEEKLEDAIRELQAALACEQPIPALAGDMQGSLDRLLALRASGQVPTAAAVSPPASATPLFLSKYGKSDD